MQAQKVMELLGYSAKEAKVYLAALALGESHISDIADRVKMPRTSVQLIIDKLYKDGLVNFYVMRRYKYWVAEKPERILSQLQMKEEAFQEALPDFTTIRKERQGKRFKKKKKHGLGVLHVAADTSLQPMLITNEEAEIEYVNTAWEKLFGYTIAEVKGKNPFILKSGKTPQTIYDDMWKSLHEMKMFQTDQIVDRKKDGTAFKLLTTVFPIQHENETFYVQILSEIK